MSAHTKGVWRIEGPDCFADFNILPPDDVTGALAAVVNNGRPPAEVLANARLVAAAPELLECIDALLGKLDVMNGCNPYDMDGDEAWPEFDALRAALAKARGES